METFYRIFLKNNGIYDTSLNEEEQLKEIGGDLATLAAGQGYRISKKIKGDEMELKILGTSGKGMAMTKSMRQYLSSRHAGITEFIETENLGIEELYKIQQELSERGKRAGPIATVEKSSSRKVLEIYVF